MRDRGSSGSEVQLASSFAVSEAGASLRPGVTGAQNKARWKVHGKRRAEATAVKQILQHLRTGELEIAEVPAPVVGKGQVLIQTHRTLISAGTERMLVEFSQANLVQKARQQPEKVKQVLDKLGTDGVLPTVEAVFRKLDEPLPLGYCNSGTVVAVGPGVRGVQPGDRVVSNGSHAELVCVPVNLCAKVPDGVDDDAAAFTVLGAIGLQGVRLAQPTLGEKFVVFGAGLIGLLAMQLLRASGCEVLAVDLDSSRLELARSFGARTVNVGGDPIAAAEAWTSGYGADGVLVTASTKNDELMHQAATVCRKRGRIVLVGVVGLNLRRSDFYEKELTFQVSCSYGPGRYDDRYEQGGQDYPFGFVRWTEQRNFEAVLGALAAGRLQTRELVSAHVELKDAAAAYARIQTDPGVLGVVLTYPETPEHSPILELRAARPARPTEPVVGVIGAGNFARSILLPALRQTAAQLAAVADVNPLAARHAARKFGADRAVTDYHELLSDSRIRAVFIAVSHHLHARFVMEALEAGKHVFVEKPLAMNGAELTELTSVWERHQKSAEPLTVMIGFNRRFSPHVRRVRETLRTRSEPLCMSMTVNAGAIPANHWTQDPQRGGGRIIGEACHFIDLMAHLAGAPVSSISSTQVGGEIAIAEDKAVMSMSFSDGSIASLNYLANGARSYPKERLEIFAEGRTMIVDNFRITRGYNCPGWSAYRTARQDKGHRAEISAFVEHLVSGGEPPISYLDAANVTRASFAAVESASTGQTVFLDSSRERP